MNGELFLHYLISRQLLTPEQKQECLKLWEKNKTPLARLLVEQHYLTAEQLRQIAQDFQIAQQTPPVPSPSLEDHLNEDLGTKPFQLASTESLLSEVDSVAKSTKKIRLKGEMSEDKVETETMPFMLQNEKAPFSLQSGPDSVETTVAPERYQVIETLGQGGMGVVQRVQDNILGREVALKKLNLAMFGANLSSPKQKMLLWRLHREAEITAILEHPNIVPLYDMQKRPNGELFFTMRKVEGETLTSILRRKRKESDDTYDESRLLSIFFKVCDAVSYAHSRKIVHRDLKPDNIMVGAFGEVYVMDWGIAKKLDEAEDGPSEGAFPKIETKLLPASDFKTIGGIGTPGYMAPEQSESANSVTSHSDIFSLGIILRQIFTLFSPMEELHLAKKEAETQYATSSKKNLGQKLIPSEIQAIVAKATEHQSLKRYRSVRAMSTDIQHYLNHRQVSAKDYNMLEIFWKWTRRHWKGLVTSFLLLLIGTVFWYYSLWVGAKIKKETIQKQFLEKQENFNALRKKAMEEQEWVQHFQQSNLEESKQNLGEQIQHLLKSLNYLTLALNILPEAQAEAEKMKLSVQIIEMACKIEDYPLAEYLAKDLDSLRAVSTNTKQQIQSQIEVEKNSKLKMHQARLKDWIQQLQQEQVTEVVQYNAIFEISKMQEKEIFEDLLHILEEGTRYFLGESTPPSLPLNGYYKTMVMALGRTENPKAVEPLLKALDQLSRKYSEHAENSLTAVVDYMEQISYALIASKAKNISKRFYAIRKQTGINKWFWKRTRDIYKEMLVLENEQSEEESSLSTENPPVSLELKVRALIEKAFSAEKRGDDKEAIKLFSEVLRIAPIPDIFNQRGRSRATLGDLSGAMDDYNSAIQRGPKAEFYKDRARLKHQLKDLEGALSDYNEVLRLEPDRYSRVYAERGSVKLAKGDSTGALQDIQEGIRLDPQRFENYTILSQFYRAQKDIINERKSLEILIRLAPQQPEGYYYRGTSYMISGEFQQAIEALDEALKRSTKFAEAYLVRGEAKLKLNDLSGALLDLQEGMRLQPQYRQSQQIQEMLAEIQKRQK